MNKETFLDKWLNEKSMYKAWGKFVTATIIEQLSAKGYDLS
ncbi:hypothetical protein [Photobacterium phosphoreum]|nr:hypothetical protein [Photobacterium phosphoreum]